METDKENCVKCANVSIDCSFSKLTSLKDFPQKVSGTFKCNSNKLTSLEGSPQEIDGHFICKKKSTSFSKRRTSKSWWKF